jgi:pimeloyl-ACP methyl ester carboxylesterase
MPARERTIDGPGGRALRVVEDGDPRGVPCVVHHGTPGCRLLPSWWVDDAAERGLRLIGYDRPGYGGSAPDPGRDVAAAAADVAAVADALGLEGFVTHGASGGGPHALACAALLGDRVPAAAVLAGVAPWEAEGLDWLAGMGEDNLQEFGAALRGADELAPMLDQWREHLAGATADRLREEMASLLSPPDATVISGRFAEWLAASFQGAVAERADGWVDDDLAFTRPWGFALDDIRAPVLLWQGRQDRMVPPAHGEWLAERLPDADARLTEEDGHLTLLVSRIGEVHAWLLERF